MDGTDQLLTITQVSVALAGFAGVVSAYQHKQEAHVRRGDALGIAMMVNIGLVDAFFSVLPVMLFGLGFSEVLTWKMSSALMAANYVVFFAYIFRNMRRIKVKKLSSKLAYAALYLSGLLFFCLNLANTFGIGYQGVSGPYFVSLILPLIIAGFMFARLVLRPLWRSVKDSE
ncbi:hypothetical protein [Pseudohongiella sp.]|uniref:Uncharacterized protein n=1 Tax=marine sediment metagenome TaxID=412755 RepID=A0A0F9WH49_9ZZZZ|nr:hypothetical protein [Pseudohongiella sp.]HDZ08998.1 hypothetical protein [Pseudohongiella sp.]HEA62683.1 hypothetical protein [Pseudohongiella sp.]